MIKKLLLTLIFTLIISSFSYAQIINAYGIKIGTTLSNQSWNQKYSLYGTGGINPDNRFGINLGTYAEFLNLPFWGIITELNYNQKGMKFTAPLTTLDDPDGSSGKTKTVLNRIDYISFAIEGKFKFNMSALRPYIFAGPRIDIYINKKVDQSFNVIYANSKNQIYGLSVGFGSELNNKLPVDLLVELQYNYDFTLAFESGLYEIKNKSFDFKIGIKL